MGKNCGSGRPGIEWKTGAENRKKKIKMENGPWPKVGKKWPEMASFSLFSPFLGHSFPISHFGPWVIF